MSGDIDTATRLERMERLLEERNALAREALATQREALAETREIAALNRANIERASEVNKQAAAVARGARKLQMVALPVVLILLAYVSWVMFYKLRF